MQSFFRVFSDWILPTAADSNGRRVGRRKVSLIVPIIFSVCPPLYLMLILWVLGVKIRYVICLFIVMSAVTGRTHIDWRYRTLKARRDSTVRCKARLASAQSQSDQSVCDTDTDVPSINEPIPSVQVQSDKVECGVRGFLRGG